MEKVNIWDVEGMDFPAGRRTRVLIGQNGAIQGERFCQGYVVIYKDGGIPEHIHETVESYTILKGEGEMTVGEETQRGTVFLSLPIKSMPCIIRGPKKCI